MNPVDPTSTGVMIPKTAFGAFLERFTSRKFVLVCFVQGIGAWALLQRILDGGTYVALSTLVLSTYFAGSVADKKLNGTA